MNIAKTILTLLFAIALQPICFAADDNTITLGYGSTISQGYTGSKQYSVYVTFPAQVMKNYAGSTVSKIRIGLATSAESISLKIKDVACSDGKVNSKREVYQQTFTDLKAGWNELQLSEPYAITGADFTISLYRLSTDVKMGYDVDDNDNAHIVYNLNTQSKISGSWCIEAVFDDVTPNIDVLHSSTAQNVNSYSGEGHTFSGVLKNIGSSVVNSYTISYYVNSGEEQSVSYQQTIPLLGSGSYQIALGELPLGKNVVKFRLSAINGEPFDGEYLQCCKEVRNPKYMNRVVMEEGTGNWCKFCVTGIEAIEKLKEQHPDDFIPICVHSGDPMSISDADHDYSALLNLMPGLPSCYVNRKLSGDPYGAGAAMYSSATAVASHVGFNLKAAFADADSSSVSLVATTFSEYDLSNAAYNVSFVVLEDSVTGYYQYNGYAGGSSGSFYGWESKAEYEPIAFQYVARGIYAGYNGTVCTPTTLVADKEYDFTYNINLPTTIQRKRKVHIVALLIDANDNNNIINAFDAWPTTGQLTTTPARNITSSAEAQVFVGREINITNLNNATISLTDLNGRTLSHTTSHGGTASLPKPLRSGLYLLSIKETNNIQTIKLLIRQ